MPRPDAAPLRHAIHRHPGDPRLSVRVEPDYGDLLKEAQNVASIQKISEILRRLVEENVPIRNMRHHSRSAGGMGSARTGCRAAGRICADGARTPDLLPRRRPQSSDRRLYDGARCRGDAAASAMRPTTVGTFLNIPEDPRRGRSIEQFRHACRATKPNVSPAVLATMDVRRHLRNLLDPQRDRSAGPVLSGADAGIQRTAARERSCSIRVVEGHTGAGDDRAVRAPQPAR